MTGTKEEMKDIMEKVEENLSIYDLLQNCADSYKKSASEHKDIAYGCIGAVLKNIQNELKEDEEGTWMKARHVLSVPDLDGNKEKGIIISKEEGKDFVHYMVLTKTHIVSQTLASYLPGGADNQFSSIDNYVLTVKNNHTPEKLKSTVHRLQKLIMDIY